MMDKNGNTFKTETKQYKKYRSGQLSFADFKVDDLLFAGYVPDSSQTQLVNFYILKRDKQDTPIWRIDKNNVVQQEGISFITPARTVDPLEENRPKRAVAKKDVVKQTPYITGT